MARSSGGELAAAVSRAGALGTFGGTHPPSNPIDIDYIRHHLDLVRSRTPRPFGVGFITHLIEHSPENFDYVMDEGVPVILLSFADPTPWLRKVTATEAIAICQVQTLDAARVAVDEGADVLAVQGNESGGHTGELNLLPFLAQALEAFPNTPIVAAGGISNGRSLAAVLAAGGDGAWIGTAFQAVKEATEVSKDVIEFILASDGRDTIRSSVFDILGTSAFGNPKWPEGVAMRTRKNKLVERWHGKEEQMMTHLEELSALYADEMSDPDVIPHLYGESAAFVDDVPTAEEFIKGICQDAEAHLRRATSHIA